jgi:glycosyltransferase involved in cell wall biosynthesis
MVSVIIPSIRPINLEQTLARLLIGQEDADFEIVCVTDFEIYPLPDKVVSIRSERKGCIDAICKAEAAASGEYIIVLSDQSYISDGGLIEMERLSKEAGDKIIISQRTIPESKLEYYGWYFAPYPFAHRDLISDLGGLFLPCYKSFYADPDFSMRAHEAGIPIVKYPHLTIIRPPGMDYSYHKQNFNKYVEADRETFKKRWAHLGEFKEPS